MRGFVARYNLLVSTWVKISLLLLYGTDLMIENEDPQLFTSISILYYYFGKVMIFNCLKSIKAHKVMFLRM